MGQRRVVTPLSEEELDKLKKIHNPALNICFLGSYDPCVVCRLLVNLQEAMGDDYGAM
jgi:hypothetical protein